MLKGTFLASSVDVSSAAGVRLLVLILILSQSWQKDTFLSREQARMVYFGLGIAASLYSDCSFLAISYDVGRVHLHLVSAGIPTVAASIPIIIVLAIGDAVGNNTVALPPLGDSFSSFLLLRSFESFLSLLGLGDARLFGELCLGEP